MAFRRTRVTRGPTAVRAERGAPGPVTVPDRAAIRELPLAVKPARSITLTAWRGRSGRPYVVAVYRIDQAAAIDPSEAVILAVARPPDQPARIFAAGHRGTIGGALQAWIPLGTDELHVHRQARTEAARDAIVRDLIDAG